MSKYLALLFNAQDVSSFIARREKGEDVTIFASGLDTEDALEKVKIPYQEIKTYPPLSVTIQHYDRAHQIALQFDPTIYASVRNFFLELFRSMYLIQTIIKKYQPSIIYVSDIINESLYRKYHAETFDLLPQAVIAFAKIYQIKLVVLRRDRQPGSLIRSYFSLLTTDLFHLYKSSRFTQALPNARRKLVISASDYHLLNLRSFIKNATKKWAIIILGKANPEIKKQLGQSVFFTDVYQYISLPRYLFIVLKQVLALITSPLIVLPIRAKKELSPSELEICHSCRPTFSYWRAILAPQGKLNKHAFGMLIKQYSPSAIIASNGIDNYNRTLLLTTQEKHVKDAVIIHHHITDEIDIIEERSGVESILFVPSQKLATMFHKFPGKTDVVVTGNPVMDEHYSLPNSKSPPFHSPLKILFLLCQEHLRFQGENRKIVLEALLELKKYPKPISVILRNHPQHPDLLHHFHRNFPFPIIERNDTPLQKELLENDIIITQVTSAAVEAIIFKKPLIYLNTYSVKNIRNFATSGAALGVYEISELIPAINSLFKNPGQLGHQQDRFISKYCGKIDGKASRRIMAHL